MYDRKCSSVRQREVEEGMKLCRRFMMVSCEVIEKKRVLFKTVLLDLHKLGGA